MNKFGFIIHPIEIEQVYDFWPKLKWVPSSILEGILKYIPPFKVAHLKNIRSITGKEIEGYFIVCPLLSKHFFELDENFVMNKVLASGRIAEKLEVNMLGLGALSGVVGEAGRKVAGYLDTPTTNGITYAGCAVLESVLKAAEIKDIDMYSAKAAVIGATNPMGKICTYTLLQQVPRLSLAARNQDRLSGLVNKVRTEFSSSDIENAGIDVNKAVNDSDIVIFTTSAVEISSHIKSASLKQNAVICDIPMSRNITLEMSRMRPDLLIVDGTVIEPPCEMTLKIDIGLPPGQVYACMAETMLLTFEGSTRDFSLGWEPSLEKVKEICALAEKHGFKPAFTSFGERII